MRNIIANTIRDKYSNNIPDIEKSKSMILEFTVKDVGGAGTGDVTLPLAGAFGVYVAWGDAGDISDDDVYETGDTCSHAYSANGKYICKISKSGAGLPAFGGANWDAGNYLTSVIAFGSGLGLTSLFEGFRGCGNLLSVPDTSLPSTVLILSGTFHGCSVLNQGCTRWDTTHVTNMYRIFYSATAFNQPIGTWNTESVTNMAQMFYGASRFNQPIGTWNTALVTTMQSMFYKASRFNQDIGAWDTSSVDTMAYMFYYAEAFNQPIGSWNTALVTTMRQMFYYARHFNQDISNWITSGVENMLHMFFLADDFNQPIGDWDITSVGSMRYMLTNSNMNKANFEATIIGWAQTVAINDSPTNITLGCPTVTVDNEIGDDGHAIDALLFLSDLLWTFDPSPVATTAPAITNPANSLFVTITSTYSQQNIYYTTDGSEPDATDNLYSRPFSVEHRDTVNAIAIIRELDGLSDFSISDMASEAITEAGATP